MSVIVFDNEGDFLHTIGRRGRDDGSFFDLSAIHVSSRDELLAIDTRLSRISRFSLSGTFIAADSINLLDMLWPRQILELDTDDYVLLYKLPQTNRLGVARPDHNHLIHQYQLREHRFVKIGAFAETSTFGDMAFLAIDQYAQLNPGHMLVTASDGILYSPSIYRGVIYKYIMSKRGWYLSDRMKGENGSNSLTVLESEPDNASRNRSILFTVKDKKAGLIIHNQSLGLYYLQDDNLIIHFYLTGPFFDRRISAELFSDSGMWLGQQDLTDVFPLSSPDEFKSPYEFLWMDGEQQVYVLQRGRNSALDIFSIEVQPNKVQLN